MFLRDREIMNMRGKTYINIWNNIFVIYIHIYKLSISSDVFFKRYFVINNRKHSLEKHF